jgi:PHD/YefM family antitoxin component YafN of YafNO toxin-antitoxin module
MPELELHPKFLTKNGKKEFVVLPYEEFEALQEVLLEARDLVELRAAKTSEATAPTIPLEEAKKQLDLM